MKECAWSVSPAGGFMVRRSDNPDQQFLIKPEPDLRPLRDWILNRLSRRPERWQALRSVFPEPESRLLALRRQLRAWLEIDEAAVFVTVPSIVSTAPGTVREIVSTKACPASVPSSSDEMRGTAAPR